PQLPKCLTAHSAVSTSPSPIQISHGNNSPESPTLEVQVFAHPQPPIPHSNSPTSISAPTSLPHSYLSSSTTTPSPELVMESLRSPVSPARKSANGFLSAASPAA